MRQLRRLRASPYIPHDPLEPHPITGRRHHKQAAFLVTPEREALYGGAAGGGKSDALLMAALMYVDEPDYHAIIFRRTYPQLEMSLIPRSQEWLYGTGADYNEQKSRWTFPSGAVLRFGHMQHESDKHNYQSAEFQFVGFDELTQFTESQYRYLRSRMRRLEGSDIPIRIRAGSNPGDVGHDWVRARFITEVDPDRRFVPAKLADNPWLDEDEYRVMLEGLDPITRQQLLDGDWSARQAGGKFKREWFKVADDSSPASQRVRYWDLAATEAKPGKDPDWTAGVLMARTTDGQYVIEDIRHLRASPREVENLVGHQAQVDGKEVTVWMEQEPGASGVSAIDHYRRGVLAGYDFHADKVTGNKEVRANPFSSQAEAGNVILLRREWNGVFLDEAEAFPLGGHDDMVDAASGAFDKLHAPGQSFFFG